MNGGEVMARAGALRSHPAPLSRQEGGGGHDSGFRGGYANKKTTTTTNYMKINRSKNHLQFFSLVYFIIFSIPLICVLFVRNR